MSGSRRCWCWRYRCCCSCRWRMPSRLHPHRAGCTSCRSSARAPQAQAIVILGGGDERIAAREYRGEAAPGSALLERLTYGAFLAHHPGLPVLVSGTAEEGLAMRASLARDFGVEVRWVEDRS